MAVVVRKPLTDDVADRIVAELRNEALPCPARGLELVVYTERAADDHASLRAQPEHGKGPHVSGRSRAPARRAALVRHRPERPVRARDRALRPSGRHAFAPIAPDDLRPVLAEVLRWYEREAPERRTPSSTPPASFASRRTGPGSRSRGCAPGRPRSPARTPKSSPRDLRARGGLAAALARGFEERHAGRHAHVQRIPAPANGIANASSQDFRTRGRRPRPSAPKTSAAPVPKSADQTGVSASPEAAQTRRSPRFTSVR